MEKWQEEILNEYCENNMKKIRLVADGFIRKYGIEQSEHDEIYSIANETLWTALNSYDKDKNDNFYAFYSTCVKKKCITYLRDMNERKKRNPDSDLTEREMEIKQNKYGCTFVSLDIVTENGNGQLADTIPDKYNLEDDVINGEQEYSDNMMRYLNKLSKLQQKVVKLIIEGYSASDIMEHLKISSKVYSDCMYAIKKHNNIKLLLTY